MFNPAPVLQLAQEVVVRIHELVPGHPGVPIAIPRDRTHVLLDRVRHYRDILVPGLVLDLDLAHILPTDDN